MTSDPARSALESWQRAAVGERLRVVRNLRAAIAEHPERLGDPVARLRQSSVAEALAGEVLALAEACRFLEREAEALLTPRRLGVAGRPLWLWGVDAEVRREPYGVILVVGASNYPLYLTSVQSLQALVAGNAVLVKAAPGCSAPVRAFGDTLAQCGLDPRLFEVLPEDPSSVDAALARGVDKIILTGSAETGARVYARAAERLIPATLELSGWDASFVRADADIDLTIRALTFALRFNGGETCIAPHRVFAAREIAGLLGAGLSETAAQLEPREYAPRTLQTLDRLIGEAVRAGARILTGGVPCGGRYRPTVLANVDPACEAMEGEVMAPLLLLTEVVDDDDALALAARCPYALGATVFGKPPGAVALAGRVRAGAVVVNDVIVPTADPRLPCGGRGRSGFGVTRGAEGLLEMTTVKTISLRKNRSLTHAEPLRPSDASLVVELLRSLHAPTFAARARAFVNVTVLGLQRARHP